MGHHKGHLSVIFLVAGTLALTAFSHDLWSRGPSAEKGRQSVTSLGSVKDVLRNILPAKVYDKVYNFFTNNPLGGLNKTPKKPDGGPPPGFVAADEDCIEDKDCKDNEYCFKPTPGEKGACRPPCHTGDCPEGFECDKGVQEDPNDNRCVSEDPNAPVCPPGQSPTGGNGGCQPDDTSPLPKGDASEIPEGCIYLKETHIAGHLVRIEYDFKAEIEGEGDIKVPCPSIDKAYIWLHAFQLNKDDTKPDLTPLVIQQSSDADSYEINDPLKGFLNDTFKPAQACDPDDDAICMGYKAYRDAAGANPSTVWTKKDPQTYGFDKYPFWRVDVPDIKPSGEFDDLKVLGYARIKSYYDDLKGNGTPQIWMVVQSNGKLYQIQGEVNILAPTATITVTTPQLTPKWVAAVHLNDGVFDDAATADTIKIFEGTITTVDPCGTPSITAGNASLTLKSGYAANITFNCPISETIGFTAKMKGLNEFDRPVITTSFKLSMPTAILKEIGCDQTLGGQPANDFSAPCADVDEKGKIKLSYKVEGRKAELVSTTPEKESQGGGTFNGTVAETPPAGEGGPPVVITVHWVRGVTISSEGKDSTTCKQDKKLITVVNTDGTKGPESDELSLSMPGIASGNVIRDRDYECFKYKLTATDLNGAEIDLYTEKPLVSAMEQAKQSGIDVNTMNSDYEECNTIYKKSNEEFSVYDQCCCVDDGCSVKYISEGETSCQEKCNGKYQEYQDSYGEFKTCVDEWSKKYEKENGTMKEILQSIAETNKNLVVDVPYQALFEVASETHSCASKKVVNEGCTVAEHALYVICCVASTVGCLIDDSACTKSSGCSGDWEETVFDSNFFVMTFTAKHVKEVKASCYDKGDKLSSTGKFLSGGSAPFPLPDYKLVKDLTYEDTIHKTSINCTFDVTHYDGGTSKVYYNKSLSFDEQEACPLN